ncbi:MAG: isoprenylcysteine carboxylmethyltransferase family protein [Bacteroidetes bacterium]|nr:isoprenylcysteine carboxylmethyltransferase family protein [Bacteroidota bacterium]
MEKIKLLLRAFGSTVFFTTLLFVCAGKLNYIPGWIYFSTTVMTTLMTFIVTQHNDDLLKERSNAAQGASWDKLILGLSAIVFVISIVLSGLDSGRFEWSPKVNWQINSLGAFITMAGHGIFLTAQKQNKFFSAVYRIQADRGHAVCDTGIYKIVRHPGYLGMIISLIGFPVLTGSLWSSIPIVVAIIILVIRTTIEDKSLIKELHGYLDYTKRTPYRLIPYIW